MTATFEGLIAIILGIAGAIFLFGQIKENARRNTQDINDIKDMISDYQKNMQELLEKSMDDMKELLNTNRINQKEALEREISHVQSLISITTQEVHEDIRRIELRLEEVNKVREKTALLTALVKSLHKRLDLETPSLLDDED